MGDDEVDMLDGSDDSDGDDGGSRKSRGPLAGIVKILIFVVGFIVFIIVSILISYFTFRILDRNNTVKNIAGPTNSAPQQTPIYSYFDPIEIRTRSADLTPNTVTVNAVLGYDAAVYPDLSTELTRRTPQITDMLRSYFSQKTAVELGPDFETRIKVELLNMINELLRNGRVEELVFPDFRVLAF